MLHGTAPSARDGDGGRPNKYCGRRPGGAPQSAPLRLNNRDNGRIRIMLLLLRQVVGSTLERGIAGKRWELSDGTAAIRARAAIVKLVTRSAALQPAPRRSLPRREMQQPRRHQLANGKQPAGDRMASVECADPDTIKRCISRIRRWRFSTADTHDLMITRRTITTRLQ